MIPDQPRPPDKITRLRGACFLLAAGLLAAVAARQMLPARWDEPVFPSRSMSRVLRISDYFSGLKHTRADTEIYLFEGREPGGAMLVMGGTHPNEPAGFLTAVLLAENLSVERGRVFVIPRANHSGFTHTEPGEAHPMSFAIPTSAGTRRFRCGCRFTNPLDQWPDPEVYLHHPSGQRLSGPETRNLNRSFPGRADGNFTERLAFAVTALIEREQIDLVMDLHEASPEYPVINAIVAHERAMDVAALANLTLQAEGISFALEPSPQNFHGLTHREIGDATPALAILMESANLMQGRLRGRCDAGLILDGKDPWYLAAARAGLLRVPYDEAGIPLDVRVGRHLAGIRAITDALNFISPDRAISLSGIPTYSEVQQRGVGAFLSPK
ncbi:MAG: succinylglutamate desuccinylase/aspartoacylase family protein [bacterium]|nr:succinylglutamate desuccinylase/aspartoacylase family protein [bacterium]